jgi:hypothetical protein
MVLESTSKELSVIQEKLRDTEKAIEKAKEEVCFSLNKVLFFISYCFSIINICWVTFRSEDKFYIHWVYFACMDLLE